MTGMTRPDCAVMCNLINTHTHTHTHSFSSRCWTFRRTHTSADPIRVLCTRLALPLTLSLTSRLAPRARLTVDVPTRAFWLAGIFLRRKKRCAGVVGTRTDWVLKGKEGGMTTPLLQYVARFDGGGDILGLEEEVTRRVGHGAPCLSDSRLYMLRQAARNQLYGSGRERS